ncbi:MAG: hypothetical protein NT016_03595 [Candidatus Aenigmarchaeota archaeon]|nr:hypothetical protein [Candidatus Aenigmarchaeota archaeon]
MRDSDIGLNADELVDLARSLSGKYVQGGLLGPHGYDTSSPLIQNKYFVTSQEIASIEKSKKVLNSLPVDERPSTDSLYFGKV